MRTPFRALYHCFLFLLMITLGSLAGGTPPSVRADSPTTYLNYDITASLQDNGDLRVRLLQRVRFNGEYSEAFFEIPTDFTSGIEEIAVWQGLTSDDNDNPDRPELVPADFSAEQGTGSVEVRWSYAPTSRGEIRLFAIEYTAIGALRVHRDRDRLLWQVLNSERGGIPVNSARITIELPPYMPADSVTYAIHGAPSLAKMENSTVDFRVTESLADGQGLTVDLEFPHGLLNAQVQEWQKQVDSQYLEVIISQFDVDVRMEEDGALSVLERMEIEVVEGVLYDAFRTIKLLYLDNVDRISVAHDGRALLASEPPCTECFSITRIARSPDWIYYDADRDSVRIHEEKSGEVTIDWSVQPLYPGDRSAFDIEYRALGTLRIDDDSQRWNWQLVPDLGASVRSASATVTLPPHLGPEDVHFKSNDLGVTPLEGPEGALHLRHGGPVEAGSVWELAMTLPNRATSAVEPKWQHDMAIALAAADQATIAQARIRVLAATVSLLIALAIMLGTLLWWIRSGRRVVRERLGGYTSEPPSNLGPGIVAYMVDGRATAKGVLASLIHLSLTGCLDIRADETLWVRRLCSERLPGAESARMRGVSTVPADRHSAYLYNHVIVPNSAEGQDVSIDDLSNALRSNLPQIYALMGQDAQHLVLSQQAPIYLASWIPTTLMIGWFIFAAFLMYSGFASSGAFGTLAVLIVASFFAVSGLNMTHAWLRTRSRRDQAVVEAEKWIRFRNYLAGLKTYGDLATVQQILERHFAYVVALGVDQEVLTYAEAVGASRPAWLILPASVTRRSGPVSDRADNKRRGTIRPRNGLTRVAARSSGRRGQSNSKSPGQSLSGLSQTLGASLAAASANVGNLLSTAAGQGQSTRASVTLSSPVRTRAMEWEPDTPVSQIMDDIMSQSMADARTIQAKRSSQATRRSPPVTADSRGRSQFRSSGGFRHSASRSRSSARSARSGGGGRSGFS